MRFKRDRWWEMTGRPVALLAGVLALASLAPAQEPGERAPLQVGNFDFSGTSSVGYRFVQVNGNRAKYNQLVNLHEGLRVFDAQLNFAAREPNQRWFDDLSITTQNLGGDPFPGVQVRWRKNGHSDVRLGYRATQYFYDLPQTSLTTNRGWIDRRRFADADVRYTPTRNLRFRFFYNRTEREGSDLSNGPFFYLPLGSEVWGAFGRANPLSWVIPLNENSNQYGLGVDWHVGQTNIHAEQGYRTYNNPARLGGFGGQPVELLGSGSPLQNMKLTRWDAFSSFNVPTTTLRIDQHVFDWLQLRAGYLYSHSSGPTSLDGAVQVPGATAGSATTVNYTGAGNTSMTSHTADFGFTLQLLDWLDVLSDYRYQSFSQNGNQFIQASRPDLPAPILASQDENLRWDFGEHTLDFLLAFAPLETLNVRAGLRFFKEDIVRKIEGRTAPGTERSWSYTPVVNVSWRPSSKLSVRGQFEQRTTIDPYTRLTPEGTLGSTLRVRFAPSQRWGIDNVLSFRNLETESLGFLAHTRNNSTNLWYQPVPRFGLQAGFSYGSFLAENSIAFLRGAAPLTGLVSTTQTIDRTYFLATKANLVSNLELSFSGQYVRSTALANLTGESSNFGPLTWPAWTAEIAYLTPQTGRFVFGWQRSYYLENLFRLTDFGSNAFTARWEVSF